MTNNKLCELLRIKHPIIQGGMVWCSGWRLTSSVSNCGGLGVIGSGSMDPELLNEHILKTRSHSKNPFAVNIPLFSKYSSQHVEEVLKHKVPIVITSAGNPNSYTEEFQKQGIKVLHVVASSKYARKAIEAKVDGIIGEGFEAGGHNGRDETTTLCLIPQLRTLTNKVLVAAGGIGKGSSMFAAMALGADGVQIGSRFAISQESSAHELFKQKVMDAKDGDTLLTLKEVAPVRLLKGPFYKELQNAYANNATVSELKKLLGKGRAKKGIFEGDLEQGELEIGQVSGYLNESESVKDIFASLLKDFNDTKNRMCQP